VYPLPLCETPATGTFSTNNSPPLSVDASRGQPQKGNEVFPSIALSSDWDFLRPESLAEATFVAARGGSNPRFSFSFLISGFFLDLPARIIRLLLRGRSSRFFFFFQELLVSLARTCVPLGIFFFSLALFSVRSLRGRGFRCIKLRSRSFSAFLISVFFPSLC